ncbi:MAG: PLP-dependent aminotransferase family protein [Chloroflexota bacterium]
MAGRVARATKGQSDRATEPGTAGPEDASIPDSLSSPLQRESAESLHRQIERRLREAIAQGRLRPGARLSATRNLARELGIARITVQTAYDQLAAEGYLDVDPRRGTRVAVDLPEQGFAASAAGEGSQGLGQRFPTLNPWIADAPITPPEPQAPAPMELGPEWFGFEAFDVGGWERLLVRAWRELSSETDSPAATYAGPLGDARLRAALADHLAVRRGVRCRPDSVALTAGSTAAFGAIARTWLGPSRVCVVEDPGGEQLRRTLAGSGARIMAVAVDDNGIRVDDLPDRADVVFITPSWQYPSGGSLSLPRRLTLLRWAERVGAIVVEDDCESELRYDGAPLPSLQGLAVDGRVIYVSTFSKVMYPGLRTGYVVVPDRHRGPFMAALEAGARPPAAVEQRAIALFLESGAFHRHVRRLRAVYAARRDAFARGLTDGGDGLAIRRSAAGGHLVVAILDERWTATQLAVVLAARGIRVEPLSDNRVLAGPDDAIVVYLSRSGEAILEHAGREMGRIVGRGPAV